MEMIVNFMLLAASGSAAVYCFILNRKLHKLKDTENGLGVTIASMSHAVNQAQSAIALAKETSSESIDSLEPLVVETRELIPQLTTLVNAISEATDVSIAGIKETSTNATADIEACLEKIAAMKAELNTEFPKTESTAPQAPIDTGEDIVEFLENTPTEQASPSADDEAQVAQKAG